MGTPSSGCIDYKQFKNTIVNPLFVDRPRSVPGGTPHERHTSGPHGLCLRPSQGARTMPLNGMGDRFLLLKLNQSTIACTAYAWDTLIVL